MDKEKSVLSMILCQEFPRIFLDRFLGWSFIQGERKADWNFAPGVSKNWCTAFSKNISRVLDFVAKNQTNLESDWCWRERVVNWAIARGEWFSCRSEVSQLQKSGESWKKIENSFPENRTIVGNLFWCFLNWRNLFSYVPNGSLFPCSLCNHVFHLPRSKVGEGG